MHTAGRPLFALGFMLVASMPLASNATEVPAGTPVLTVTGTLTQPNIEDRYVFDMAMLEQLPQHSFTTSTPWYPKAHTFTGPLLRDILTAVGSEGTTLTAIALNDYKVAIPVADSTRFDMIVSLLRDDKKMAVRDKGPLFIIYPFDIDSEAQSQVYYNRSIWQLKAIHIE